MSNTARIPLRRELVADFETPLSVYQKLARGPNSYLFESVQGGEKWGRYSLIGLEASTVFKVFGHQFHTYIDSELVSVEELDNPLDRVAELHEHYRYDYKDPLRFTGGLVGFFGYDTVRYVEKSLAESTPEDVLGTPDIALMVSDEVAVFDNLTGTITLIVHTVDGSEEAAEEAIRRLDQLETKLQEPLPALAPIALNTTQVASGGLSSDTAAASSGSGKSFTSSFGREQFIKAVEELKAEIQAGVYRQVVPSQRLSAAFEAEPINLYRALRRMNPSPYLYFLDMGDYQIVGSSPEVHSRLENGKVTVRPIAGTRRRGADELQDLELEKDLLQDPKEIAEHVMLIDLGIDDIDKISKPGTVEVTEKMVIERYSHVMHIVSNVEGEVAEGHNAVDVLKATLPSGTLSGAPKVSAMTKIDQLEPVKRGIYGGAVGYLGWNGNMDTAIAIRTAVIKDGQVHVQAGAGIVADSDPESEWVETMNKAEAAMSAVDMAQSSISERRTRSDRRVGDRREQDRREQERRGSQSSLPENKEDQRKAERRQHQRREAQRRQGQRRSD